LPPAYHESGRQRFLCSVHDFSIPIRQGKN
jgi:hypothetical protein